ncbi:MULTISPECIES: fimbria/pilus outer membrane usher protein [unclassified Burkholderia]|uniref:fimbria/pilus outer membrane usher protein n=1 Tax=unclassified Burkholderia TaxID=2613784 RepID=UPI000F58211D|nr:MULTISPECIES: fimbria/pilus outer membrane usher protein [unclassified Burkholderia]RQR39706.1 fimbrial protein [Burkholderia sp. Bp9142]RQR45314.1 fimbrial protein [Burkholderia sp. Bp9140]
MSGAIQGRGGLLALGLSLVAGCMPCAAAANPGGTAPDALEFDAGMLREHGIDAAASRYFAHAPRFMPGTASVRLTVNGKRAGRADVRFDDNGNLCATPGLLRVAGLVVPDALRETTARDTSADMPPCYDYRHAYPQAIVTLRPADGAVDLVVPADALDTGRRTPDTFERGGFAGLVNYDLLAMTTRNPAGTSQYWQATTEAGFNAADWIVRSSQIATAVDGHVGVDHQAAYAQRTFASRGTILQAGQIVPRSTLFSIGRMFGVQTFPDEALAAAPGTAARVTGIARTQARVEVRQLGVLIHSSQLPPGPFALGDLPLVSGTADLDVTIVEATGDIQHFIVPGSSLPGAGLAAGQGLALAVGRLQNDGYAQAPWLATATHGWQLWQRARLNAGILVSSPLQSGAASVTFTPLAGIDAAVGLDVSRTAGRRGTQARVALASSRGTALSANVSFVRRTPGYRELTDAVQETDTFTPPSHTQFAAALGWHARALGMLSLDYTRVGLFDGPAMQRVAGTWTRLLRRGSVALNVNRTLGTRGSGGTQVYVTITVPIGTRSVSAYANVTGDSVRSGARYSDTFGRTGSYGVAADYDTAIRSPSIRATVSATPNHARATLNAGLYGAGRSTIGVNLRGAVALLDGVGMLSPYEIRDTFALASVGERAGIELATPSGPVWTDRHGRAVIASLPPYAQAFIRINTKSLPRDVDLKNGMQTVEAGRGSVSRVEFAVEQTRRVLLTVTQANGAPLPVLSTVIDDGDRFVTVTGSEGRLLLTGTQLTTPLRVALPNGTYCRLAIALPDTPPATTRYYERAEARCESLPASVADAAQKKSGMPTAMPPTPTLFFPARA